MAQAKGQSAASKKKAAKKKGASEEIDYPEGIFGPLPEWIPDELAQDYEHASYHVTRENKGKDINRLVQYQFKKLSDKYMNNPAAFIEFREEEPELGTLVMIKAMLSSGEAYAYQVYVGWDKAHAFERAMASVRGSKARSKRGPDLLNEEILKILKSDPQVSEKNVLRKLEEICDDTGKRMFTFTPETIIWFSKKSENVNQDKEGGKADQKIKHESSLAGFKDRVSRLRKK